MKYIGTYIKELESGKFKIVIWGQPDWHIMDWRGCNYRVMTPKGQPHRGFETIEEADAFAHKMFPSEADAKKCAEHSGDGSFLGDNMPGHTKDIRWEKEI